MPETLTETALASPKWAKVVDHSRCIGCHACTTACKSENEVPLSVTRTYVKYVDVGFFPQARRSFQVTRCNQCDDPPCVAACPTAAMYSRPDGIVDFDKSVCIGCKACIAACPYDAIFINPEDHSAEKCNFCAHRLDIGLEPACVVVCPVEALLVGDMNDPASKVSRMIHRDAVAVRRPEKETRPKLFYKGADQAALDPLGARRPDGGLFMWSEQGDVPHQVPSGAEGPWNSSAAAVLAYDVLHRAPWDWRVSLYTWTKSVAAGAYLVAALLALSGSVGWDRSLWSAVAPVVSLLFLGLTGALLIWDLEHPKRFYMIFTRPQWKSWLVRGGVIISVYGAVLVAHLFGTLQGPAALSRQLLAVGLPFGVMTAVYTAFLFAQARGRDLWQSPLLPPHLFVQALFAGSGVLALVAPIWDSEVFGVLTWVFALSGLVHLLMVVGELTLTHPTAHARAAARAMTRGRYAPWLWTAVAGALAAVATPYLGVVGVLFGLVGLFAFEHAYVQAGQSVPLA
jgi:Fe-S-cluster-containing dehydrogenase component/formate-dependent nitrite reductase membrane component NrfD